MKKVFLSVVLMFFVSFAFAENRAISNPKNFTSKEEKIGLQLLENSTRCLQLWFCLNLSCRDICIPIDQESDLPSTLAEFNSIMYDWEVAACDYDDGWGDRP